MPLPLPLVIRTRDLVEAGHGARDLRREAEAGRLVRLVPGAYVARELWEALDARQRYVARSHAVASRLVGGIALSHWTAAAVWGLPVPDAWPREVQVTDPRRSTSTTRGRVRRRPGELRSHDLIAWEGVALTSAARTAADIALISPFDATVAVFDTGLRLGLFTKADVAEHLARRPRATRYQTASAALEFADPAAEYPGESFSRVAMLERGLVRPVLQEPFFDGWGKIGHTDFWWADVGVAGEFDGQWKYTDPQFLRGRTAAEVIRDEKRRQGRLEAHPSVRRVVRWDYAVARNSDELARQLVAAGVHRAP